jgi:hypothetical protein
MFLQGLIPLSGALAPIRSQLSLIVKPETVPLAEARGRILARDIIAGVDLPSSLLCKFTYSLIAAAGFRCALLARLQF